MIFKVKLGPLGDFVPWRLAPFFSSLFFLYSPENKRAVSYKGDFGKCALVPVFVPGGHANVPSFRFSFRANMRTCPRSGCRSGGTCERTLVPVFVPGEHPPKPPFCTTSPLWTPDPRSTTTRDRLICNFGAPSPLDFLIFSSGFFLSSRFYVLFSKNGPKMWRKLPDFRAEKKSPCHESSPAKGVWQKRKVIELLLPTSFCGTLKNCRILSRLWLPQFFRSRILVSNSGCDFNRLAVAKTQAISARCKCWEHYKYPTAAASSGCRHWRACLVICNKQRALTQGVLKVTDPPVDAKRLK